MVQEPYWFLFSKDSVPLAARHGSPWRYDTFVPIIFAGADIPAQRISRLTHPVHIAPTLSNYRGIKPSADSVGVPLYEVLSGHTE